MVDTVYSFMPPSLVTSVILHLLPLNSWRKYLLPGQICSEGYQVWQFRYACSWSTWEGDNFICCSELLLLLYIDFVVSTRVGCSPWFVQLLEKVIYQKWVQTMPPRQNGMVLDSFWHQDQPCPLTSGSDPGNILAYARFSASPPVPSWHNARMY